MKFRRCRWGDDQDVAGSLVLHARMRDVEVVQEVCDVGSGVRVILVEFEAGVGWEEEEGVGGASRDRLDLRLADVLDDLVERERELRERFLICRVLSVMSVLLTDRTYLGEGELGVNGLLCRSCS
jgi:hypothetical protein